MCFCDNYPLPTNNYPLTTTHYRTMPQPLYDNHHRPVSYLRLSVTDRCNLRCFYCMPAEGVPYVPHQEVLTYEEMLRLVGLMARMGISKVRITGGEPFVRKGLMDFLWKLTRTEGVEEVHLTTNGVLTAPLVPELKQMGIASVNLSLDTLDRDRFRQITRRDELPRVMACLDTLLAHQIPTKLNAVVMEGQNIEDLIPLAGLTRELPISVRFIEEMPFDGSGAEGSQLHWNHHRIVEWLKGAYPGLTRLPVRPFSTSVNYTIPGHAGTVGIIAAYSRTFCGTCNRIRMTATGELKTCLYGPNVLALKPLLRSGSTDQEVEQALRGAFGSRAKDGFEAEQRHREQVGGLASMSAIGG